MKNPQTKFHAPEHDHRYEAAAIKAERQDVADNPTPMKTHTQPKASATAQAAHVSSQRPRETDLGYQRRIVDTKEAASAHTPGPWICKRNYPNSFKVYSGEITVCEVDHWGKRQSDLTADLKPDGEPEANARLIAAAPELLAACQSVEAWFNEWNVECGPAEEALFEPIRAAIAKS